MSEPLVSFQSVGKRFGETTVLDDVSFTVGQGSVHALMGENGAGKSTLIKVLCGIHPLDRGRIEFAGEPLQGAGVAEAGRRGIAVIHQEIACFDDLSAAENIFLGREPARFDGALTDAGELERRTLALFKRLEVPIDPGARAGDLSTAQKQILAVARALAGNARLLVMDEPTACLSRRESETLFRIIREISGAGGSVLYVSHRMEEIFALCDSVTVLRDGRHVRTAPAKDLDHRLLVSLMVGRDLVAEATSPPRSTNEEALRVDGLSLEGSFEGVSLAVGKGELVCLTGLVGAGRTEVVNTIFGIHRARAGSITLEGKAVPPGSPGRSIQAGLALVPEERAREGLVLPMTVEENLLLSHLGSFSQKGVRRRDREQKTAAGLFSSLRIKAPGVAVPVATLSGGNQQKVSLGKWLAVPPKVLLLDEPTRGVDVGAKADLYRILRGLAAKGMGALIVSSDLPEVLALADRILVLREGRLAGELSRAEATQEKILSLALPTGKKEST